MDRHIEAVLLPPHNWYLSCSGYYNVQFPGGTILRKDGRNEGKDSIQLKGRKGRETYLHDHSAKHVLDVSASIQNSSI